MRQDGVYPYQFIRQVANRETFSQAVAEIRYQHELRLWKDQEERRLFNITLSTASVGSCSGFDGSGAAGGELGVGVAGCFGEANLFVFAFSSGFSDLIVWGHHRRRENELRECQLLAGDAQWRNAWEVYREFRKRSVGGECN